MSRRCVALGLGGLLTIFAGAGRADAAPIVQMDFVGVGRAEIVSIAGVRTGTFWAGELNWTWYSPTPEGWADDFYTYCVDVLRNATYRQTVSINDMSEKPAISPLVDDGALRAAWLFDEYAAGVHTMVPESGGNAHAAALQLAIWEVLYDSDFNLATSAEASGGFRVTSASTGVWAAAVGYLDAVSHQTTLTAGAAWLDSTLTTGQDQMTHTPVPEPSTLLLLGASLAGVAARRQSRGFRV